MPTPIPHTRIRPERGGRNGAWVRFPPKMGYVFPQRYYAVFGGILKYPFVIPVSVRIEEAFLIHANTRTIPIKKKKKVSTRYRSGDTSLTGIGL